MEDDQLIPLSALQHYLYCPRQCALIHIEQQWAENRYTAEGRILHDRADQPTTEQRHGMRTATAMPLVNRALGITGIADVVELHECADGVVPFPVEYKRGRKKRHRADEVQLCAQAFCLESMFDHEVAEGAIYYGKARRRHPVLFDQALRQLTRQVIADTRAMLESLITPPPKYDPAFCDSCSLVELCQPLVLEHRRDALEWLRCQLKD